ncbi:MAG: Na+/H+ antiporter NhaA [Nitrospira sp.]|nr:Na+/H+ antiporter NhaA [Nitrospira sp.]
MDRSFDRSFENQGAAPLIQPVVEPFQKFIHAESAGGILLLISTVIALVWANSPWSESYAAFRRLPVTVGVGDFVLTEPLVLWINDGLMAMFFFVIGLEIKREVLVGELSSLRQASLPLAAALGGSVFPAVLYASFNAGTDGAKGWGIPMATDIAFSLGILSLLGKGVPLSLKVFLVALAIADDLCAVLIIAFFYTSTISWGSLAMGGGFLALLIGANMVGVRHPLVYGLLGIGGLWLAFLLSGVHPTIAGVLAAFTIPARTTLSGEEFIAKSRRLLEKFQTVMEASGSPLANQAGHKVVSRLREVAGEAGTPLQRLEQGLHPWVTAVVLPLFALANAGVSLEGDPLITLGHPVALGIMAGLVIGKPAGILLASWSAIRAGAATMPSDLTWRHLAGVGFLAGIGFTMSLFIEGLAFGKTPLDAPAKVGILAASAVAGSIGWTLLRRLRRLEG